MASTDTNLSRRQALAGLSIMGAVAIPCGAAAASSAMANRSASTMRSFRYGNSVRCNANFDGDAFIRSWARFVGSAHRHHETLELVLFWSVAGPHPQERDTLRARLEADPGNVGAVLAAIDRRTERDRYRVQMLDRGEEA